VGITGARGTKRPIVTQQGEKAEWERRVFIEFATVAGLHLVRVDSQPPPEPDLLCEFAERGRIAFELVNLVDQDLMRAIARSIEGKSSGVWFGDPTLDLVAEKVLRKNYETQYPMELLAYGDDTLLPYDVWTPTYEQRLKDLFDTSARTLLREPSRRTFQRLWVANLGRLSRARPVWLVHPPL
jgi:hypothetical protein